MKKFLTPTYCENTSFPGTEENPMLPAEVIHPETGEVVWTHCNTNLLISDKDYEDVGLEYHHSKGWGVWVEVSEKYPKQYMFGWTPKGVDPKFSTDKHIGTHVQMLKYFGETEKEWFWEEID